MANLLSHCLATTLTCISIHLGSLSSAVPKVMLALRAGKLSSTLMVDGVHMEVGLSLERIRLRSTGLQLIFAGRWPSPWLRVVYASVPSFSFRMRSEWRSLYPCSLRRMGPNKMHSQ